MKLKIGPRLFSIKLIDPGFFDRPKWMSIKCKLTLWCEHSRQPLPFLNYPDTKTGVYEFEINREWVTGAIPYLKALTKTLTLVLPLATSVTQLALDDATYKSFEKELDLGEKSLDFALKSSDMALDSQPKPDPPELAQGKLIRAEGSTLRKIHVLLKEKDPDFGGLIRVQNKRREFLWVHPQFVGEY